MHFHNTIFSPHDKFLNRLLHTMHSVLVSCINLIHQSRPFAFIICAVLQLSCWC